MKRFTISTEPETINIITTMGLRTVTAYRVDGALTGAEIYIHKTWGHLPKYPWTVTEISTGKSLAQGRTCGGAVKNAIRHALRELGTRDIGPAIEGIGKNLIDKPAGKE